MFVYYIVMGIISFILYAVDKWKAVNNQWRIPEKVLLMSTVLGGFLGTAAGMYVYQYEHIAG
ncbi:hypothetical protein JH06_3323 [Blastocystis sp. subtype 4]|uniref:hypothetical protein n=1 Tax=Blastocystis sp. subtype 4 TaxID=944170 RepID=UPI000711AA59|nr:hypothetical protein JH06_3323 [Blastocystis sp. subtype 4]KNB42899.1 hypothetical protein JH06_3323 [Blastocystis sp. subtype 4]|eukprot:XP_014526342.1 hypothetical protein JH06_3323 [Blastocystis sp. subtype 4]